MSAPKALRDFQLSFGRYLRSPETEALPTGIDARRARVYEELLYNNVCGFINTCFPVCKQLTKPEKWATLLRSFFRDWRASSPLFKDIPEEFLHYLQQNGVLATFPAWFYELAHYEWIELYLETAEAEPEKASDGLITVAKPLVTLMYQWQVHQICEKFVPKSPEQTCLIVLRKADNTIKFIETNPATVDLVQLLQAQPMSNAQLINEMAARFNRPSDAQFAGYCEQIITDLIEESVLIK